MDNPARPLRGYRRPLARAATIAMAAVLLFLGLGDTEAHAYARLLGGPPAQVATLKTTPQETAVQFHVAAPRTENPETTNDGNDEDSGEEHRFWSPGLLWLAGLVAVTALVGTILMIRSRRRPPPSQETER
ncbi:hypothetical protein FQ154_19315 [Paeniglutamicibacter gangotriensis]|uniref:Uncharacterized protein n=1 Tax=Paeniglutamicibacter gangotriensis TaxID=254787 RepID=A0A5B0E2X8_9MICC|nr:hypothetical protein [Paeniglutamicibacter gangotriensis]KAA0973203.1 hypothetical protein FQ154_19315 [Paeniglutamicibacter gangotriensis]